MMSRGVRLADHLSPDALPHVRRWVVTGAALVTAGYLTSVATRVTTGELAWMQSEIGAVVAGALGLVLALRGHVRAAGALVLVVVWAELHFSIATANPSLARYPGLPVFPVLVVATGLFFGGRAAIAAATISAITVPIAVAASYRVTGVSQEAAPFPFHVAVVIDLTMVGSAVLVWQGLRSFRAARHAHDTEARRSALLVEHAPYGIVLLNQAGRIETLNPAAESVLGGSKADLIGRALTEVLGPAGEGIEVLVSDLEQKAPRAHADLTLSRSGGRTYVEASGSRTILDDGTIGALVVLRDVTQRREMERHTIQLGRLLDQAPYEMYVFDADSLRVRFANLAARRATGYGGGDLDALTVTDVMPALTRGDVRRLLTDLTSSPNDVIALVGQHRRKDGTTYPVEARLHLVSYGGESAVGLVATDISDRVVAEEEQERLRGRMLQTQRFEVIQQLAGGIAHEFNNLLMSIGGYAEMITEFADEERVRNWADRIRVAQQRGATLIRQLLALGRTDLPQPGPVALGEALREFLPVLERTLGPTVHVELDASGRDVVLIDRSQVEQVVLHLATNARDAMPGGGTVRLVVQGPANEAGDEVRLEVHDTGRGMAPEIAQRAFDPFFTGKPRGEGTGLGLTTVRSIVTRAGGHVELDSTPGLGTIARVRLPASRERIPPRRASPAGVAVEFVAGASGDILVVEDDADTRAVVTHALTRAGYQVRAVGTAQEGLTWLTERQGDVDLVLTDIALPDMTGFAFAGAIADRIAPLRILYMSGYAREHIAGAPAGFDPAADLLIKPFSTEKLLAAVRFTLERTRGRVSGPEAGPET